MNSKLRILSAFLAIMMIFSVALVGCSDDDNTSDVSKELHAPNPKPIEKITLQALQVTVPENSPIKTHKVEFQMPAILDKEYEDEAYFNYRVEYSLDDYKMADAALDKKIDELYKDCTNVWFTHRGDEVFQISDNSWGIIKTVRIKAFTKDGVVDEEVKFVLTGIEENK